MKNFKVSTQTIVAAILGLLLILTLYRANKIVDGKNEQITTLQLEKQKLNTIVNTRGEQVTTQQAIVTQSQAAIRSLTDSIFALTARQDKQIKDVIAYYRGVTNTTIKQELVPYVDQVAMKKFSDSVEAKCREVIDYYEANTITVPRTAKDTSANYDATLTATKAGIRIDSLNIIDTQDIRIVSLKGGLLKKDTDGKRHFILGKKYRIDVKHSNRLGEITKQNSVYFNPAKKLNLIPKIILIGVGAFLGTKL